MICAFCAFSWLPFGVLEYGIADFNAVGNREDARFLALTAVFQQHDPVRSERLLHCSIIVKFPGVFHRNASRIPFLVLEPKHTERFRADVITGLSLLFINE